MTPVRNISILTALAVVLGVMLILVNCCAERLARPKFDLLFSIDYNDGPYANPTSTGVVIRVENRTARAIFTGNWQQGIVPYLPGLYICEAATGMVRELFIPFEPPHANGRALPLYHDAKNTVITMPNLASLIISSSNTAPDGYKLSRISQDNRVLQVDFKRPYKYLELIYGMQYDGPLNSGSLKDDNYRLCLSRVGNNFAGLNVHFVGWIIPR